MTKSLKPNFGLEDGDPKNMGLLDGFSDPTLDLLQSRRYNNR